MSSAFVLRSRNCPVCGGVSSRTLGYRGGPRHHRYALGVTTRIVQCKTCSLVFANPFPYAVIPSELYADPAKYFAGEDETDKVRRLRILVREMQVRLGQEDFSLLDVGCGRGELLAAARAEGVSRVMGLDLSQEMVDHVQATYGVNAVRATAEEFSRSTTRRYDVVSLSAVLEHVYEPNSLVAAVSKLTRPGSILYFDVPCEPSLRTVTANTISRLLGRTTCYNLSPTWSPYHVIGFNPRALRILLDRNGFRLESLRRWSRPQVPSEPSFGGQLLAFGATQVNRLANLLRTAGNMTGWARKS